MGLHEPHCASMDDRRPMTCNCDAPKVIGDVAEALRSDSGEAVRVAGLRTFTMYRRYVPAETHDENQRNAPDEPQFEGVVFSDGRVAVRWLTAKRSVSVWDCMEDMLAIHGHPEYGSVLIWHALPLPTLPAASGCEREEWLSGRSTPVMPCEAITLEPGKALLVFSKHRGKWLALVEPTPPAAEGKGGR